MCPPLNFILKRADTSQHIPRIALSFNGRTPGFGPGYRGSNPRGATNRGFCRKMESPFSLNGGFMHGNEIRITKDNQDRLIQEAEQLGPQYVAALKEQIERQGEKTK